MQLFILLCSFDFFFCYIYNGGIVSEKAKAQLLIGILICSYELGSSYFGLESVKMDELLESCCIVV